MASGCEITALNLWNILSSPKAAAPVDGQHGSLKQALSWSQDAEMLALDDSKTHYGWNHHVGGVTVAFLFLSYLIEHRI